jgi:hypothetical protein
MKRTWLALLAVLIVVASAAQAQLHYQTITIASSDVPAAINSEVTNFVAPAAGTATVTYTLSGGFPRGGAEVSVISNSFGIFSALLTYGSDGLGPPVITGGASPSSFEVSAGTTYYLSGWGSIYNPQDISPLGQGYFQASLTYPVWDFTFTINDGKTTITGYTGSGGAVTIPGTINGLPVTSIGGTAFYNCTSLTSVTIPDSVTNIGEEAFGDCTGLTNVTIGNGVTSIGANAFELCSKLAGITLPNSLTSLGDQAFWQCAYLTNITIPNGVTSIGIAPFGNCARFKAITVNPGNPVYGSINGVLFGQGLTTLIEYPEALDGAGYAIPAGVTSIGQDAFYGNTRLVGVTIPGTVTGIGSGAFFYCSSLTSATIPGSVNSIGGYAFGLCSSLTNVYFEGNAPTNGGAVFYGENFNVLTTYYLPGATGWSLAFWGYPSSGPPAILWNPLFQAGGANFGVQHNQFGFTITNAANLTVVVEACTNLTSPVWIPLQTVTLTNGSFYFSDPQWTNYPGRYYRLSAP